MGIGLSLCVMNSVILCVCVIFLCVVFFSIYVTLNVTVTGVIFSLKIPITIVPWMSMCIRIKQGIHSLYDLIL